MRTLAFLAACLCAPVAVAQPACEPGRSVADVIALGQPLVESGEVEEMLVIKSDAILSYVKALQAMGTPIPNDITEIVVVIRKDKSAAIFGFKDGCYAGKGQLPPGMHQRAYGAGA